MDLDTVLGALASAPRRALLGLLADGEKSVNDLAGPLGLSQPTVSVHLKALERAGLVSRRRDGTRRMVRLDPAPLADLEHWLGAQRQEWTGRLERLEAEAKRWAEKGARDGD